MKPIDISVRIENRYTPETVEIKLSVTHGDRVHTLSEMHQEDHLKSHFDLLLERMVFHLKKHVAKK